MARQSELLESVCSERDSVNTETLENVVALGVELARQGREGQPVGTAFTVGDEEAVLESSRSLILDPLAGHGSSARHITDADARETLKELSMLDGAFVVSDDGEAVAAARYFDADSSGLDLPLGLGSRHVAAAAMTRETQAVAVVVSKSSVVRLMDGGELVAEVLPELWIVSQYSSHIDAPVLTRSDEHVTVLRPVE